MRPLSFGLMFLGLSLILPIIVAVWTARIPDPAWTQAWSPPPRWTSIPSSRGAAVTVQDLADLSRGFPRGAGRTPSILRLTMEPLDLAAPLSEIHASIRTAERMQWERSSRMMSSHLETRVTERLASQEGIWKERLNRRRHELAEEDERLLAAYAAKIRREALPKLSALQMELALCTKEERKVILEEELGRLMGAIEEEISKKGEELEKAREHSLEELHREARESLERLAAELRAEAQRVLADYLLRGEEAFSAWLTEDLRAEAALMETWGFGPESEIERDDGGEDGG